MNTRILKMLTKMALENPGVQNKFKLAAAVVYKKHIIATGVNSYKTHPIMERFKKNDHSIFLHAEVDAIKNALKMISQDQLTKCDLYIVRVKKDDNNKFVYGLARPCKGCVGAIAAFGLKNIFWTEDDCNLVDIY